MRRARSSEKDRHRQRRERQSYYFTVNTPVILPSETQQHQHNPPPHAQDILSPGRPACRTYCSRATRFIISTVSTTRTRGSFTRTLLARHPSHPASTFWELAPSTWDLPVRRPAQASDLGFPPPSNCPSDSAGPHALVRRSTT